MRIPKLFAFTNNGCFAVRNLLDILMTPISSHLAYTAYLFSLNAFAMSARAPISAARTFCLTAGRADIGCLRPF